MLIWQEDQRLDVDAIPHSVPGPQSGCAGAGVRWGAAQGLWRAELGGRRGKPSCAVNETVGPRNEGGQRNVGGGILFKSEEGENMEWQKKTREEKKRPARLMKTKTKQLDDCSIGLRHERMERGRARLVACHSAQPMLCRGVWEVVGDQGAQHPDTLVCPPRLGVQGRSGLVHAGASHRAIH